MQTHQDHKGRTWRVKWGVFDDVAVLKGFGITNDDLVSTGETVTFVDPLWRERKTLHVYEVPGQTPGKRVVVGEITAGIYAVGYEV